MISVPSSSLTSLSIARNVSLINRVRFLLYACLVANFIHGSVTEYVQEFQVSEGIKVGSVIGYIGDSSIETSSVLPSPPYLIVPVPGSAVDTDLLIDQSTGEIRTNIQLDRETRDVYFLIAVPISGENVRVIIRVNDENDNAPSFPVFFMTVEFPENTPRDVKRTLPPALDPDVGLYTTQRYDISSGNINNAFRLSSHREKDGILYLDLQVNGFLDREAISVYNLVLNAYDGGRPPLKGSMIVNVTIQDVNDNQPVFNQSRYTGSIPENDSVGSNVLQVFAHDADDLDNGRITYFINRRQSDKEAVFRIDSVTGMVSLNRPLDFESKDTHELVIVARDNGPQTLETTAFVTIHVIDVNDNQPVIDLIYLSDDGTPKVAENAKLGEFLVRISVSDADSNNERSNVNVSLSGGEDFFGLTTRDEIVYLIFVAKSLDREKNSEYSLEITATDQGDPPLHASRSFNLIITDVNDNAPRFDQEDYFATIAEAADPGTTIIQVHASDSDEGENARVVYSLQKHQNASFDWFHIDPTSGLITTSTHVDCEVDPMPHIIVIATDSGSVPLSSSATVSVTIRDVNDNEPIFDQSFYNVSVYENETVGTCILKVSATDRDCGINALINYTLGETGSSQVRKLPFRVLPESGKVCIANHLDFETRSTYEFPISATDKGGLSTTAVVKVHLIDVNDNLPVFYPQEYNVSLRPSHSTHIPVVAVMAVDDDSEKFGNVFYRIESADVSLLFRIDSSTGEIFVTKSLRQVDKKTYRLIISAVDNEGCRSRNNAEVLISIIDPSTQPPIFEQPRYVFSILENVSVHSHVGQVKAIVKSLIGGPGRVKYSISSGDPSQYFKIDPDAGIIVTNNQLDHEANEFILLSVLAAYGEPPAYGHAQVNITILDVNDNVPEFESTSVKIFLPENAPLESAVYVAHAEDADSEANGKISYRLIEDVGIYKIDVDSGALTLAEKLDYEQTKHYSIVVEARDSGVDPLSSQLTINIEIQDVNDNFPVFDRMHYEARVMETLVTNSQFLRVRATDKDTGNNARITYKISENNTQSTFGIFPHSGWIYLKEDLDRENTDSYSFEVIATDNGIRPLRAKASVTVIVLDVNDNDPYFFQKSYFFYLPENFIPGKTVAFLNATDKDIGENADLRFMLFPEDSHFEIKRETGEIISKQLLDRETKSLYEFTAQVKDRGNPPRHSQTEVKINIEDVNDNSPEFIEPNDNTIIISSNQRAGYEITKVSAVDRDEGENGTVYYYLAESEMNRDNLYFSVNSNTGSVTVRQTLENDVKKKYNIKIGAKDGGRPPLYSVLMLTVEALNSFDSVNSRNLESALTIKENVNVGAKIGSLAMSDQNNAKANSALSYFIISGNEAAAFYLDHQTGDICTVAELDRETINQHFLLVEAYADDQYVSSVRVNIQIDDINDNPPKFSKLVENFTVPESAVVGTVVANVTAADEDSDANALVTYLLKYQYPVSSFDLDSNTGLITLRSALDHENISCYVLIVVAVDKPDDASQKLSSWQKININVVDVNDNSPKFLSQDKIEIYENERIGSTLLRIIAVDDDSGQNGEITYSIVGGNEESIFYVNHSTGVLTLQKFFSRNRKSLYQLNITATDGGSPPLLQWQIVKVFVHDVFEEKPKFDRISYDATVMENKPPGTHVLSISVKVESHEFKVKATDGGRYAVRSAYANVRVILRDVNDNSPRFRQYPFFAEVSAYTQPGSKSLQIAAEDADENLNGKIEYRFQEKQQLFKIDPDSGIITTTTSLTAEAGQLFRLPVIALDQGSPSKSSLGLVEIKVQGYEPVSNLRLSFSNSTYETSVAENAIVGTFVLKVVAARSDARKQSIYYSLVEIGENHSFEIDRSSGVIRVRDNIDYERQKKIRLMVEARSEDTLRYAYAHTTVWVNVLNRNDHAPVFTQDLYFASVWEGNNKGAFVVEVRAIDKDDDSDRSKISYSIIEGNHDNAFMIDSSFSGVVKTNIVLDREIAEKYELVITAVDEGEVQLTGTCTLIVSIIDMNDNQPIFPPQDSIFVDEDTPMGSIITTVVANDVDTFPVLMYTFVENNSDDYFNIDLYSGEITLAHSLDYEKQKSHTLHLLVSDSAHTAETTLTVHVNDVNDNAPVFTQDSYFTVLPELNEDGEQVLVIKANDMDSDNNGKVKYSLHVGPMENFYIDEDAGVIYTNRTSKFISGYEVRKFIVIASDMGQPQLSSIATVQIQISDVNNHPPIFEQVSYRKKINSDLKLGSKIIRVKAQDADLSRWNKQIDYSFSEEDKQNYFKMSSIGEVFLVKKLDAESTETYNLQIIASDRGIPSRKSYAELVITPMNHLNSFPSQMRQKQYEVSLNESVPIGHKVLHRSDSSHDAKLTYTYKITAGDDASLFQVNSTSGELSLKQHLDYDTVEGSAHVLLVATYKNNQHVPFCLTTVIINVEDSNDNAPAFPLTRYEIFVPENFRAGTSLTQIRAVDNDFGIYGILNYTISDGNEGEFSIDHQTAMVTPQKNFDYEARSIYCLRITATDLGGNKATTNLVVNIKSQDEYPPIFSQTMYRFLIADNLPRSHIVGTVHASDQDRGLDGRVIYQLKTFDKYFSINKTNGTIFITKLFFSEYKALNVSTINVIVEANSGRMESLTSSVVAEITIDPSFKHMKEIFILEENKGIAYWAVTLVIIFTVLASCGTGALVYLRVRNKKRSSKTPLTQHYDSTFDTATNESCYLPHYNDIATYDIRSKGMNHQRISTREFSERSHSSGRGSAEEDVDDEEIKMINEVQLLTQKHFAILPDSGVQELDDNSSDISVQNTQEYLARLGIDIGTQSGSHHDTRDISESMHSMHMFDEEGGGEGEGIVDISSIICRKVNVSNNEKNRINTDTKRPFELDETHPSMSGSLSSVIHSEEELTGSYNWDYLLDWGPQYQPLAHVFSEIASLKDDDDPISSFTAVLPKKVNFSHTKVIPPSSPPILTNIIPRKSVHPSITLNKQKASQQHCLLPSSNSDLLKLTTPALSPSFSPSLSPLARRSPSVSPLIHSYRTVQPYYISMPIPSDVIPEKGAQSELELRI